MGNLIYCAITSLDGHIEDEHGNFGWGEPDAEVHAFINDLMRPLGTYLYGRRLYETMAVWETDPSFAEGPPIERDFAEVWHSADKIVYSRTLKDVTTSRTRIERDFEPDAVRTLKSKASSDLAIGGAELAARAFRAGVVDECQLFLAPVVIGRGKRALPDDASMRLELLDERRFASGFVYLRYRTSP